MNPFLRDEKFLPAAIELVTEAKKSIYISTFKIELTSKRRGLRLKQFFDVLQEKHLGGVDVRILTNKRDNRGHIPESNAYAFYHFKKNKIPIRSLPNSRVVHAKLLIVDERKAILGSHNLSIKSCHNNFEMSFLIDDPVTLAYLESTYSYMWFKAK